MDKVRQSYYKLWDSIDNFAVRPHEKDALYLGNLKQWRGIVFVSLE